MEVKKDLKFNCAERTLQIINSSHHLPDFGPRVMRIASNFGGGVAGWGGVCGAVSSAIMALGMVYGTDGTEAVEEFSKRRANLRSISQGFLEAFEGRFGSVSCLSLIETDLKTEDGRRRYETMKERGELHCGEYVEWAASYVLNVI